MNIKNQLYQLAYYDTLTGCYNRNMLEKMRTELDDKEFLVIMIDLDDLKHYNTAYGHVLAGIGGLMKLDINF